MPLDYHTNISTPGGGIPWNREAALKYYKELNPKWKDADVEEQVFKLSTENQGMYSETPDTESIMHYAIPKEVTMGGFEVRPNSALSPMDKENIGKLYPRTAVVDRIIMRSNAFSSSDRIFAADGNKVYWQSKNQLRGAQVSDTGDLGIFLKSDDFHPTDRLFAVDGSRVFWKDNKNRIRGAVIKSDGGLDVFWRIDGVFKTSDIPFSATADGKIYWQSGKTVRGATWQGNKLDVFLRFDSLDPQRDRVFAAVGNRIYWQDGENVRAGNVDHQYNLRMNLRNSGFNATDRLIGGNGNMIFWQNKDQFRGAEIP